MSRPSVVLKFRPGRKKVCSEEILEQTSSVFHHVSHVSFIPPLVTKTYAPCFCSMNTVHGARGFREGHYGVIVHSRRGLSSCWTTIAPLLWCIPLDRHTVLTLNVQQHLCCTRSHVCVKVDDNRINTPHHNVVIITVKSTEDDLQTSDSCPTSTPQVSERFTTD